MKKLLIGLTFATLSTSAIAAHGPAGCGLGSMLLADQEGLVMNILAATTNGTSGNQTFGMSTGTLGCEDAGKARVGAVSFVEANFVSLSNDIARGNGETLAAYLKLINKEDTNTSKLRNSYETIFAKGNNAQEVNTKIISIINS